VVLARSDKQIFGSYLDSATYTTFHIFQFSFTSHPNIRRHNPHYMRCMCTVMCCYVYSNVLLCVQSCTAMCIVMYCYVYSNVLLCVQ
jgi:hypothetical protein